jgi:hypothetical protein
MFTFELIQGLAKRDTWLVCIFKISYEFFDNHLLRSRTSRNEGGQFLVLFPF